VKVLSAIWLALTIVATISVMWVKARWATAIPEISMCGLAGIWALWFLAVRARPQWSAPVIALTGVLGWSALQIEMGFSAYPWQSWLGIIYWTANLATFWCALQIFEDREIRGRFLRGLVWFAVLLAVLSCAQALTSNGNVYWQFPTEYAPVFGPFLYRNQFAAFIELVLPIALFIGTAGRSFRPVYLIATAILFGAVIVSGSRGGFALASAELIAVPLLARRGMRITRSQIINAALVSVAVLLWLGMPEGSDRLISGLQAKDPFIGRREFDISSLAMIRARPLTGFGMWNWPVVYPGYALFDDGLFTNQAHNDWLQWTVEGGIPLLGLMLWIAVWVAPRAIRTGWGLGVLAVFIHCAWDYPIQRPGVALVFFTLLAALAYDRARGSGPSLADPHA
jgi:hypothetical protein